MYEYKARVVNVVDGDTVDAVIDLGFKVSINQRLRLDRIDTPERGEPGYVEAKAFVFDMVGGKEVTLKTYKVSKWGYYLADILLQGKSVSDALVSAGLAKHYDGGKK
jgi:micrococcal nuclease